LNWLPTIAHNQTGDRLSQVKSSQETTQRDFTIMSLDEKLLAIKAISGAFPLSS